MKRFLCLTGFSAVLLASCLFAVQEAYAGGMCYHKGHPLQGRVQIVNTFPDLRVQVVQNFPDLKVQKVKSFPDSCGKWQIVDTFPDLKVQIVDHFPDLKIQYVSHFPGRP